MARRTLWGFIPAGCGRWAVAGVGGINCDEMRTQGSCRAACDFGRWLECVMLPILRTPMNMKTSHNARPHRSSRSGPWSSKNIRLLRAALRVWELKQPAAGR